MWTDIQEIFVWAAGPAAIFAAASVLSAAGLFAAANVLWRIVARAWPRDP
jgi:hypothetical protein